MPTYVPAIGDQDEFDGIVCNLDQDDEDPGDDGQGAAKDRPSKAPSDQRTGHMVIMVTMLSIIAAVAVTGTYGLYTGDWLPLTGFWSAGAAPFGAILTKYTG